MARAYVPELDGVQAVAVLFALLFHIEISALAGAFRGLDVVFAISGYLITRIIVDDVEAERFSFAQLYTRRLRRLFPSSRRTSRGSCTTDKEVLGQ
jgi:peptidoglycan/LPS O-acetylase OafA/YrhL